MLLSLGQFFLGVFEPLFIGCSRLCVEFRSSFAQIVNMQPLFRQFFLAQSPRGSVLCLGLGKRG